MYVHTCTHSEKEMVPKYSFKLAVLIVGQTLFTFQSSELAVVDMGQQESFPVLGFIVSGDSQNGQVDISVEKTPVPWGALLLVRIKGKPAF